MEFLDVEIRSFEFRRLTSHQNRASWRWEVWFDVKMSAIAVCKIDEVITDWKVQGFHHIGNFYFHSFRKKEEPSLASSLLNIICYQNWYQSKSDYMDRALASCFGNRENFSMFFFLVFQAGKGKILHEKKTENFTGHKTFS